MSTLTGCSPSVSITENSSPKSQKICLQRVEAQKSLTLSKSPPDSAYPNSPLVSQTMSLIPLLWQYSPTTICSFSAVSVSTTTCTRMHKNIQEYPDTQQTWNFLMLSGVRPPSSTLTGTYGFSSASSGWHTWAQLLPTSFSEKKNCRKDKKILTARS